MRGGRALLKKVVQIVQIGGRGVGSSDKIQKKSSIFSGDRPLCIYEKVQKNLGRALPPLIWTKSKRTAVFPQEDVPMESWQM